MSPELENPLARGIRDIRLAVHEPLRDELDVAALASALDNVDREYDRGWTPAHYARAIAAEYRRLRKFEGGARDVEAILRDHYRVRSFTTGEEVEGYPDWDKRTVTLREVIGVLQGGQARERG